MVCSSVQHILRTLNVPDLGPLQCTRHLIHTPVSAGHRVITLRSSPQSMSEIAQSSNRVGLSSHKVNYLGLTRLYRGYLDQQLFASTRSMVGPWTSTFPGESQRLIFELARFSHALLTSNQQENFGICPRKGALFHLQFAKLYLFFFHIFRGLGDSEISIAFIDAAHGATTCYDDQGLG